jgi:hypothetical protein
VNLEECEKIWNIKYGSYLKDRRFYVRSAASQDTLGVTALLKNQDDSFYYPVTARMEMGTIPPDEGCALLLDFLDSYFESYFHEDEDIYLTLDWTPYSWEGVSLEAKGQIQNLKLERMADAILEGKTL